MTNNQFSVKSHFNDILCVVGVISVIISLFGILCTLIIVGDFSNNVNKPPNFSLTKLIISVPIDNLNEFANSTAFKVNPGESVSISEHASVTHASTANLTISRFKFVSTDECS